MAGQLRSSVGFLGGGGVTPSPTPTPKARLARFILVPYGAEGEVQVLTDTYGRILTELDNGGGYRTACVYVPGDSRLDWDTAGDYELVTLLGKYGYNDALTFEGDNITINDNGESETLIWDDAAMDFTVDVELFQNGAQNMYFKTVNDGNSNVTVLVDADGKAIMAPTLGEYTDVLFSVANNGTEIDTITDDDTYSRADIINACGGSVNVTALDAGGSVFLLVMGTHVQYCNADDLSTTPSVLQWLPLKKRDFVIEPGSQDEEVLVCAGTFDGKYVCTDGRCDLLNFYNGEWIWGIETGNAIPANQRYTVPFASVVDMKNGSFTIAGVLYTLTNGVMTPAIE